jgi:ADP-ribose pyrophosphatase YjhB (NUDIX family)
MIDSQPRQVCSSCGTVFYEHWKVSAGARIIQEGRLLLICRQNEPWAGCWHMPAGYVENGEPPSIAAEREVLEETGLCIKTGKLIDIYLDHEDPRGDVLVMIYGGNIVGGSLAKTPEASEAGFFSPEEIGSLSLAGPSADQSIGDWLKEEGYG